MAAGLHASQPCKDAVPDELRRQGLEFVIGQATDVLAES